MKTSRSLSQKTKPTKLVMGVMVAAFSLLIGTAGVAHATSHNPGNGYGGGNIIIDIGDIIGDNNVIIIIVNYLTGGGQ